MDIEITGRRRKDLLGREELELEIDHAGEATPSGAAVRKKLAAEEDLDPATVEIVRVVSSSGRAVSRGEVHVHDEPVLDEVPEPGDEGGEDTGEPDEGSEPDESGEEEETGEEPDEDDETDEPEEPDDEPGEGDEDGEDDDEDTSGADGGGEEPEEDKEGDE